ncbi:uncharacterized protein E0L32_005953 [Thyridium curvatum]|uniref:Uncharacterized protein n=1 Tax=Thyridium curvatum TaxID=1093900 RepID=A0A507BAY4_9PEZI|nr:uncharacterized protein E0L32_005953 [Thyridium curvatum]TPX13750.1 hypothetical protein E0L32_005953 [Thyridium curvatum]
MNATKRKFNALLQGIGSRPTSSTASDNNNHNNDKTSTTSFDSPRRIATTDSTNTAPAAGLSRLSDSGSNMRSAQQPARPPSNSSVADQLDFLSKRRRIGQPASTPSASSTTAAAASTATRISNVVLRKWSGKDGSANAPPPRYCPGDREQLVKRLATFQELTDWTPKPDRINEIEWAKNGWVCQGKERLRCTLCSKEVVVKLTRKDADGKEASVLSSSSSPSEVEEALVDRYVEMMVSSHQEDCLWRKKGCDDTLLRLPLAKPRTAQEGLRQRYDELCARRDFLPYEFNLKLPEGFDLDAVLSNLPPNFFTEPPPPPPAPASGAAATRHPNRPALALAALGWQGLANPKIGPVPNSASCHTCLRRLGLWMFKSKEVDPDTGAVLVPALMDHLDPVREHRPFCPWRSGAVQRNPGSGARPSRTAEPARPAWEVLAQVLKNDAYLRNRASTATMTTTTTTSGAPAAGATDTTRGDQLQPPATPTSTSTRIYGDDFEVEDEAVRAAKDKERWARLRKVKSLFNTKGGKKLGRSASRPGTGHSTLHQHEGGGST